MELKKIQQAKVLIHTAKALSTFVDDYIEKTKSAHVDKHNIRFEGPGRSFQCFSFGFQLSAYTGNYGSSDCYVFRSIENEIAQSLMERVLNRNMRFILDEMAKIAEEDALALKADAIAEIAKAQAVIDSITSMEDAVIDHD